MPLLEKEGFFSSLNVEDITDGDKMHAKRLRNKKIGWLSWVVS